MLKVKHELCDARDYVESKAQSPIEIALALSLYFLIDDPVVFIDGDQMHGAPYATAGPLGRRPHAIIALQRKIDHYVADIYLRRFRYFKNDGSSALVRSPVIVVECDGHNFHERTKDQARHDKERDRWMLSKGIRVFRFTGSEIFADPIKCAMEVVEFTNTRGLDESQELEKDEHGRIKRMLEPADGSVPAG